MIMINWKSSKYKKQQIKIAKIKQGKKFHSYKTLQEKAVFIFLKCISSITSIVEKIIQNIRLQLLYYFGFTIFFFSARFRSSFKRDWGVIAHGTPMMLSNSLCDLSKPEIQFHIHKSSPILPTLILINPIPRIETYFFNIHSNIAHPSTPRRS